MNKINPTREHRLKYFIDDRAETCLLKLQAGLNPIVFSLPWNQGQQSFKSVASWREILALRFDREPATP